MAICRLCGFEKELQESHIIPAFASRWIKETGATGFLRDAINPNKRIQDTTKMKLLCRECEVLFSRHESIFASKIFQPYVAKELDARGISQGHIKEFKYDSWLLHFIISIQWRFLISIQINKKNISNIHPFELIWRKFLLNTYPDTGICESYMIFLHNLSGEIGFPNLKFGQNVNRYILTTTDATTFFCKKKLGIYSKIGPIVFFTSLYPSKLKGNFDSRVHMRGIIKPGCKPRNTYLNRFIFITRPNEIFCKTQISDKQNSIIKKDYLKNPKKSFNSLITSANHHQ